MCSPSSSVLGHVTRNATLGLASVLICIAAQSTALCDPKTADINGWKNQPRSNCFDYAFNLRELHNFNNNFFRFFPGAVPFTCDSVVNAVSGASYGNLVLDPPVFTLAQNPPQCPAGACLVALAIDPSPTFEIVRKYLVSAPNGFVEVPKFRNDFHFWRLNADGTWSGKPGPGQPEILMMRDRKNPANLIPSNNPYESAEFRGRYSQFCGYFCYRPIDGPAGLGFAGSDQATISAEILNQPLNLLSVNEDASIQIGIHPRIGMGAQFAILETVSDTDIYADISYDMDLLRAALPSGPKINNPNWAPFFAEGDGDFGGYTLLPDSNANLGGAFYRVYQGVVEVRQSLVNNNTDVAYYADNRGLGDFLASHVIEVPEPSASALLIAGAAAMAFAKFRKGGVLRGWSIVGSLFRFRHGATGVRVLRKP